MEPEKNAYLRFVFEPQHYSEIDLTFHCNEDLTYDELLDYFKRFAIAMSYSSKTVYEDE